MQLNTLRNPMSIFFDLLSLTFKGLRYRPLRSWLTIVGIVIGIMLVVIILSLGDGIQGAIRKNLQAFGSDLIIIFPGKESNPFISLVAGQKFKEKDLADLKSIPGVQYVIPEDSSIATVEFNGEKQSSLLHGTPWEPMKLFFEESQGFHLQSGQWPSDDLAPEVVLGSKVANKLFKSQIHLGDEVIIKSKRLKVKGIIAGIGDQTSDAIIYTSLDVLYQLTGSTRTARAGSVKVEPGANIDLIAQEIRYQLSQQEVVKDFTVLTPDKATDLIGGVLLIVEFFLLIMALISLLVGAVGIMNTMYTSVLERTRQIGVMKAVGASKDMVLSLFLIESGLIGLVGGMVGIFLGVSISFLIGLLTPNFGVSGLFSFASIDYFGLLSVLVVTFVTGIVAGYLPARHAASMEPAEALRYE